MNNVKAEQTELSKMKVLRFNNEESHRITRECIRLALIYLMNEKPFEKITITEIVRRSGVSRTAFYRNYTTKEDVLIDEVNALIEHVKVNFKKEDYYNRTHEWLMDIFADIKENLTTVKLLLHANMPITTLFPDGTIIECIFPSSSKMEHYMKSAANAAFLCIVREWIDGDTQESLEDMVALCENMLSGIKKLNYIQVNEK